MNWGGLGLIFGGALAFLFPQKTQEIITPVFGPFQVFGPQQRKNIDNLAFEKAKIELIAKEGRRNEAYYDSEGILTIGIGHKVTAGDNIRIGQRITDAQIDAFFQKDIAAAFSAAQAQAQELGKYTAEMIVALTSVNFQLGTNWRSKFKNTWSDLKAGNVASAIQRIKLSKWAQQTPVRVAAFISSIERVYG